MRVLVTWGSRRGGTEGLAREVAATLRTEGHEVVERPARQAPDLEGFDAVVVGGALYAGRWHPEAARFVDRRVATLRRLPVWLFSSGPLDASAAERAIPPVEEVAVREERVGAQGHVTFGGALAPDARGSPALREGSALPGPLPPGLRPAPRWSLASAMAKKSSGDWRDPARVEAWARAIAAALPTARPLPSHDPPARSPVRLVIHATLAASAWATLLALLLLALPRGWALLAGDLAAPVVAALVARRYFAPRGALDPLRAALVFTGAALALGWLVTGLASLWPALLLILGSTWLTGLARLWTAALTPPERVATVGPTASRGVVVALALFSAVSAVGGGAALVASRHGATWLPPLSMLEHTPFRDWLGPGLLLGVGVGGTSLVAAILAWRRSVLASDALTVAGGALTVWIVAEMAMFRSAHPLQLGYGVLGLALLALGLEDAWRSALPRRRWWLSVSVAEATGFLAPVLAGVVIAASWPSAATSLLLVVAAGLVEGFVLGAGQAGALPFAVRRGRYAALTALGAGLAWLAATIVAALAGLDAPPALVVAAGIGAAAVALLVLPALQWTELRRHARGAGAWIGWTALAWALALPFGFAPGPFVDPTTPPAAAVALWACGGLLMAFTMAIVTWEGARRLRPLTPPLG